MNSSPTFHFVTICEDTVSQLYLHLERDESSIILGPRGVGKRTLVKLVRERASKRQMDVRVAAFANGSVLGDEEKVAEILAAHSSVEFPIAEDRKTHTIVAWSELVQRKYSADNRLLLFITNLDGVSKRIAFQILASIQTLTNGGCLGTLVTAEGNLIDLVDGGPNSPWSCANQYVVHAHGLRYFTRFVTGLIRQFQLRLPPSFEASRRWLEILYQRTGGDISQARIVLWSIVDSLKLENSPRSKKSLHILSESDIPEQLTNARIVPSAGVNPFQHGFRYLLAAARETYAFRNQSASKQRETPLLDDLVNLLGGTTPVMVQAQPHPLELAGLAKRDGSKLTWFCPYIERFSLQYLDDRQIGDYYALSNNWEEAYRHYEKCPLIKKSRPLSDDDNIYLTRLIDGLAVHFHRLSNEAVDITGNPIPGDPLQKLRSEARRALQQLLGFQDKDITCWIRDWQGDWFPANPGIRMELPKDVGGEWLALSLTQNHQEDELHGSNYGYHWVVCRDIGENICSAILVDGTDDPLRDYPVRQAAIFRIFRAYRRARERLATAEGLRESKDHSQTEASILKAFWELTGANAWESGRMLTFISSRLIRSLPSISRLVFCTLYPCETGISYKPVYDSNGQAASRNVFRSKIIGETLYPRQTYEPFPLSADEANTLLGSTGIDKFKEGVVGIMHATGLLLVEKRAGIQLAKSVPIFLRDLAARLSPVWDQAARLQLLHESINAFPSLSVLLDSRRRIVYVNEEAVQRLNLKAISRPGWQEEPIAIESLGLPREAREALEPYNDNTQGSLNGSSSLKMQSWPVHDVSDRMPGTWLRDCHRLRENQRGSGWVLTFRNRAFLYGSYALIRDLENVLNEKEALSLIAEKLKTFLSIESAKIRIYIISKDDPDLLVGKTSIGLSAENTKSFENGAVSFQRTSDRFAWKCLDTRKPEAFKHKGRFSLGKPDDPSLEKKVTRRGMEYTCLQETKFSDILEKVAGDVSIDFPLVSMSETIGKLTLNISEREAEDMLPEVPQQMGALSFVLGAMIDRVSRDDLKKHQMLIEATDQALKVTAHNLLAQIGPFSGFIARYRLREPKLPGLKDLNDELAAFHAHARSSIKRIKDRVGRVTLQREITDLSKLIKSSLSNVLWDENGARWGWVSLPKPLPGYWDKSHLTNVFIEMCHNSLDFAYLDPPLKVCVSAETKRIDGVEWVEIHLEDNGRGVPNDLKDRIFAGKSYRREIGSGSGGLGLSYARHVIEAHGGSIREVGEHRRGAKFVIRLPITTEIKEE